MKTLKLIYLLCVATIFSCSSSDDSSSQRLPNNSYYKITVDGTTFESNQLTSALGTFVVTTDENTGEELKATLLQLNDDEILLSIQAHKVNGNMQPLSNEQETNDSFILISINEVGYYSNSGTVTILEENHYQENTEGGLAEVLMEFSGVFVNANDENDIKNVTGKAFVKRFY